MLAKTSPAKALSSLAKTAAGMLELFLTPSIQRLFLLKKAKTPALGSLIKSLIKAPRLRKAPVPRKTATDQIAKAQTMEIGPAMAVGAAMATATAMATAMGTAAGTGTRTGTGTGTGTATATTTAKRKALGLGNSYRAAQAQHQEVEQAVPTRSRRVTVKRVIFEAGKN